MRFYDALRAQLGHVDEGNWRAALDALHGSNGTWQRTADALGVHKRTLERWRDGYQPRTRANGVRPPRQQVNPATFTGKIRAAIARDPKAQVAMVDWKRLTIRGTIAFGKGEGGYGGGGAGGGGGGAGGGGSSGSAGGGGGGGSGGASGGGDYDYEDYDPGDDDYTRHEAMSVGAHLSSGAIAGLAAAYASGSPGRTQRAIEHAMSNDYLGFDVHLVDVDDNNGVTF
ncbi:MAG TPA: hypothetical protein VGH54_28090 [Mycobacterium sp.]|uniref:hypothetical protein n=1 Tax=Mycobacterium sp. TaxID=1785 RepID=UPI002F40A145